MLCSQNYLRIKVLLVLSFVLGLILTSSTATAQDNQLERLQTYLERNEELLIWAHDLVSETESNPARRVLRQARDLHQRSLALMDDGKLNQSFGVARRVREAVWSAVGQAREAMGLEERLRIRDERFRDRQGNLLDRARKMHNESSLDFLRKAEHQATRARELYLQGDLPMAMKLFENAETLLDRAARILGDNASPEQVDNKIEQVATQIENVRERLGDAADPAAVKLLTEADEALARSRESRDSGQLGRALQMASRAGKLARHATHLSGQDAGEDGLKRQLDSFDFRQQKIAEKVNEVGSEAALDMLQKALELGERAHASADEQEIEQALRQIRAAHDLLNHTEDMLR